MVDIVNREHLENAAKLREMIAVYRDSEDLIHIGAYQKGSNDKIDKAIEMITPINDFLKQDLGEFAEFGRILDDLRQIAERCEVQ